HDASEGRPRECMALAQLLVDRGVISYAGGTWTLPERLASSDLPSSATDVFRTRVAQLDPRTRRIAQAQALALDDAFTRDHYAALEPDASHEVIENAIGELLDQQIVQANGATYRLS